MPARQYCLISNEFMNNILFMSNENVRLLKTVRLGKRSQMVLPKEVRDWLGVEEGQSVVFQIGDDGIRLVSAKAFAKSTLGTFSGAWGKKPGDSDAYLRGERSSWGKAE